MEEEIEDQDKQTSSENALEETKQSLQKDTKGKSWFGWKTKKKEESKAVKAIRAEMADAECPSESELREKHGSFLEIHADDDLERHFSL